MNPQVPDLRYPIGKFSLQGDVVPDRVAVWIDDIAALPADLKRTVSPLNDRQLDTPYRPGGWTVRQVVHHLADSHMNSYIRFKLALTEDRPVIKAYDEKSWAELPDSKEPIAPSLDLLGALHRRWVDLLRSLNWAQLQREFVHPESGASRLAVMVGAYSWHGRHHLAHIERLLDRRFPNRRIPPRGAAVS